MSRTCATWAACARPMPVTWAMMTIGTLALIGFGIPGLGGFAGFYSKDAIIEAAFGAHGIGAQFAFWCGISAALLTSFYSWRLAFMTFEGSLSRRRAWRGGEAHDDHNAPQSPSGRSAPAHESPWVMLAPLFVLAAGAVFAGAMFAPYFLGAQAHEFWRDAVPIAHGEHAHPPTWVIWAPLGGDGRGLSGRGVFLSLEDRRAARHGEGAGCTRSSTTNGISTRFTISSSSKARAQSAICSGRLATRRSSTGWAPTASPRASRVFSRIAASACRPDLSIITAS